MAEDVALSRRLARVLRHRPESAGLTLGPGGWVPIAEVLAALGVSRERLDNMVAANAKQRFAIAGELIRAQQGHSVEVDLDLEPATPPALLWHGTSVRTLQVILAEGLTKQSRHAVHLSSDAETAERVGSRRGRAAVLVVDAAAMAADGITFTVSGNGVWLVEAVPPQYLSQLAPTSLPANRNAP